MQRDNDTSNSDSSWSLVTDNFDLIDDPDSASITEDIQIDYSTDDDVSSVYSDVEVHQKENEELLNEEIEESEDENEADVEADDDESDADEKIDQISVVDDQEALEEPYARYYASPTLVAKSLDQLATPKSDLNGQKIRIAATFSVFVTAMIGLVFSSTWNMERCLDYKEMRGVNLDLFASENKLFSWRDDEWEDDYEPSFEVVKAMEVCQKRLREVIRESAHKSALVRYMKLKEQRRKGLVPPPRTDVLGETSLQSKAPQPCSPLQEHPCHSWPPHPSFFPTPEPIPQPCAEPASTVKPHNLTHSCPITHQKPNKRQIIKKVDYNMQNYKQFKPLINHTTDRLSVHKKHHRAMQAHQKYAKEQKNRRLPNDYLRSCQINDKCNITEPISSHLSHSDGFRSSITPKQYNSYITFLDTIPPRQCKNNSTLLQCERCWWTEVCPEMKKKCTLRRWQRLKKIDPKDFVQKDAELQKIFNQIGWTPAKRNYVRPSKSEVMSRRSSTIASLKKVKKTHEQKSASWLFRRQNQRRKIREASTMSDWFFSRGSHRASLRVHF
ncbi:unnamed protein product [Bursaphelenchus okinawaensis]|uniref:Uncharacterized protein n=1 Tax=Bursaphelenchus okinawaensis TaxID=465554 RepID=A0A811JT84_9BILA|nr:unnamed protein product [Bursaphelenchus okinawaensis]CAG9081954.1 unnamed protein product [Bursaphelenchus okinawaensis]